MKFKRKRTSSVEAGVKDAENFIYTCSSEDIVAMRHSGSAWNTQLLTNIMDVIYEYQWTEGDLIFYFQSVLGDLFLVWTNCCPSHLVASQRLHDSHSRRQFRPPSQISFTYLCDKKISLSNRACKETVWTWAKRRIRLPSWTLLLSDDISFHW